MFPRVDQSRGKDAHLSAQLEVVEAQLSLTSPSGLQPRMEALKAACRWAVLGIPLACACVTVCLLYKADIGLGYCLGVMAIPLAERTRHLLLYL